MSDPLWARTLIVIPALNEAAILAEVVAGVRHHAPGATILVVDDGSKDRTGALAHALGCEVLRHPFNLGHGAALQSGYRYAAGERYAFVVQLDGDGQHDPAAIPDVLAPVAAGQADVSVGSRFLEGPRYPMSWLRRTTISFFSFLVRRLTGLVITDPTSGFQALSNEAFTFHLGDHFPPDFPDADVVVMTHRAGLRVCEVPVQMRPHRDGHTMHRGMLKLYYVFKQLVSLGLVVVSGGPKLPDRSAEDPHPRGSMAREASSGDSWSPGPSARGSA